MTLKFSRWVIVTVARPTVFGTASGAPANDLASALLFTRQQDAERELEKYDAPEEFQVRELTIAVQGL